MTPTAEAGRIFILPAFFYFSGRLRLHLYIYCACPVSKLSGKKTGGGNRHIRNSVKAPAKEDIKMKKHTMKKDLTQISFMCILTVLEQVIQL